MIQELFGRSHVGILGGEKPVPCGGGIVDHGSPSASPSVSSSSAAATTTSTTSENNLRCPRCDSSNTKFCYYNNYNLTQPRHFCKTCRRYWTKGGALRNVPIGGGCRKNKTATIGKSGAATKFKNLSSEMGQSGLFGGFEHGETLSSNPIIWAASQNSHILSLIRGANQTPNPNHLTNSVVEVSSSLFGSRAFGLDHLGPAHLPSSNSFYKNQALASQGIDVQEAYQYHSHRLRTTSNYYPPEHAPVILGDMTSSPSPSPSPSTATAILESAPVATADQMGFWNPNISWPTNNRPYP